MLYKHDLKRKEFQKREDVLLMDMVQYIIINIREGDIEDYGIDISCFGVCIGEDLVLSMRDLNRILKYRISKKIVREWRDMISGSYYSERVEEAIKKDKGFKKYNLTTFNSYFSS